MPAADSHYVIGRPYGLPTLPSAAYRVSALCVPRLSAWLVGIPDTLAPDAGVFVQPVLPLSGALSAPPFETKWISRGTLGCFPRTIVGYTELRCSTD